ncbi:hypothetical protein B0T19DRAFT_442013 [Cercophora scortea]|uniref:ER-bound oxygenase mpaB/mpaB'/Rubber oxygenase catalytic domain-containing protein n=1 Tax=Cercophora scortea TaxID=314031 RepID=A0AAE0INE0_9PEZI|nr:hypothetical protein B0T19DRAFT_442013 [Cercophora scortea]
MSTIARDYPRADLALACENLIGWTGGPYAILLQFAAPGIAQGTCTHSSFKTNPLSRLRRTAAFILAVTHGTPAQRSAICSMVRRQHARVHGPGYDARDAALQMWTAATIYAGVIKAHEAFVGEMSLVRKAVLCRQAAAFATCLDMPAEMWPGSLQAFETYFDGMLAREVGEVSKDMARVLMFEVALPWWLCWALPVVRLVTAHWLPPRLREAYGLPDPKRSWWLWRSYAVLVWVVWLLSWLAPRKVERGVFLLIKRDMERAAEGIERTGRWTI